MQNLKLLLLLSVALLLAAPSNAQRITGVMKLGMTQTTFSGDLASGPTTWENVAGLVGGGAAELRIVRGLSAVGEVLYYRMGAKTRVQYNDFPGILTSRSSYLTFPILGQFRFESSGTVRPRIFLGGAALYALESVIIAESTTDGQIFVEEDDSIETFDYGLMFGAGLDLYLASQRFTIEARSFRGRNDVTKPHSETGDSVLTNQGWAIMLGVLF